MGGVESTERQERFSLSNETSQRDLAKQLRDLSLQQSLSFSGQVRQAYSPVNNYCLPLGPSISLS